MRWKTKAAVQTVFSRVPGGESLNYLCQRRIFRSLPLDDDVFRATVGSAVQHLEALRRHGDTPVEEARFYEFGAGKDLIIPLALYCFGVNHQTLVDIRRLVREELVVDAARRLDHEVAGPVVRRPAPALTVDGLDNRLTTLGITYRAPCDARTTGLADGVVDYITSTSTLEHIDEPAIRLIMRECRRILGPQGRLSLLIDYQDHYSYADSSISAYNFLQYDDATWARWSPSLQYQNRLRHSDYLAIFAEEGFDVLEQIPSGGSPEDLELVGRLTLAGRFAGRGDQDLTTRTALVVLKARVG